MIKSILIVGVTLLKVSEVRTALSHPMLKKRKKVVGD